MNNLASGGAEFAASTARDQTRCDRKNTLWAKIVGIWLGRQPEATSPLAFLPIKTMKQARKTAARPVRKAVASRPVARPASGKARRGFAVMRPEDQREIARKGGMAVSKNRRHMAELGSKGGLASGRRKQEASND